MERNLNQIASTNLNLALCPELSTLPSLVALPEDRKHRSNIYPSNIRPNVLFPTNGNIIYKLVIEIIKE